MFKKIILLVLVISVVSCAQESKNEIRDDNGKPMLVGMADRSDLADTLFGYWFTNRYDGYKVKADLLEFDKSDFAEFSITLVMGTWCSDSRREVPRFYKIIDALEFPPERVRLIAVNRDKVGLADEVDGLDIEFVPTMIFYLEDAEIGRIIEAPVNETLEEDITEMVKTVF